MKKTSLSISAFMIVLSFLGLKCNDEPESGNFSLEAAVDTTQTAVRGVGVNFDFTLVNHTANPLTVSVDVPQSGQNLPEGWFFSLCDESACYPTPFDFEIPPGGTLEGLHVAITSGSEGSEGSLILKVTAGEEVEQLTFTLQVTN